MYQKNTDQKKLQRILIKINNKLEAAENKKFVGKRIYKEKIKGVYIWGSVGSGKTSLMEEFYREAKIIKKKIINYNNFIIEIQDQLHRLNGINPLQKIAKAIAKKYTLICVDEFRINDTAEAAIIQGIMQYLVQQNTTIVCTSNIAADKILDGLFNEQNYQDIIKILKESMLDYNLESAVDYRLQKTITNTTFIYPITEAVKLYIKNLAKIIAKRQHCYAETYITIANNKINTIMHSDFTLIIDFKEIFCTTRNTRDYTEITKKYHLIVITNLDKLQTKDSEDDATAKRFINFVDQAYNHKVKIIITAHSALKDIYSKKGLLRREFNRCYSRIYEMQSQEYILATKHTLYW